MTPFTLFMLWLGAVYLLTLRSTPLQPDQLTDDLADVDVADVHRALEMRNTTWWESPQVNLVLSRRVKR